jgi:hypothetical protein
MIAKANLIIRTSRSTGARLRFMRSHRRAPRVLDRTPAVDGIFVAWASWRPRRRQSCRAARPGKKSGYAVPRSRLDPLEPETLQSADEIADLRDP